MEKAFRPNENEMESYETSALVVALCMMFLVLAGKAIATVRLSRLEHELKALENNRQECLNRLRVVENEKAIANANISILTNKKLSIIKRREILKKQVEEYANEQNERQERADSRKVKM